VEHISNSVTALHVQSNVACVSACVRRPTLVDGTRTEVLASTTEGDRGKAEEESKKITDIASTCAFEVVSLRAC